MHWVALHLIAIYLCISRFCWIYRVGIFWLWWMYCCELIFNLNFMKIRPHMHHSYTHYRAKNQSMWLLFGFAKAHLILCLGPAYFFFRKWAIAHPFLNQIKWNFLCCISMRHLNTSQQFVLVFNLILSYKCEDHPGEAIYCIITACNRLSMELIPKYLQR